VRRVRSLFNRTQHAIEYKLVKSAKRKTLSVQVKLGKVIVRAPNILSTRVIDQFVYAKQGWITQKVLEQQENFDQKSLSFVSGQKIIYLGERTPITILYRPKSEVQYIQEQLMICISHRSQRFISNDQQKSDKAKSVYFDWLKLQAQSVLPKRLEYKANETSLKPSKLTIKRFKARWGSCNSKGEISLNYLLMCCPVWVIDYVIVHELCHLVHMNHSIEFWQLVEVHCPEYREAKNWLKTSSIDIRQ
jgi:predicted metal-dependent hydrolase